MSDLPKGWIETMLEDACAKISDGTHHSPKEQYDEPAKGLYKYVTAKNIRMAGLDLGNLTYVTEKIHREIYNRCNPELGDVLLTKDGVNAGDVAINTLDEEFSLLSSVALLKPKRDLLEPKFLRYFIESPEGTKRLLGEMRGAAIRRIILRSINAASIPIAPLAEQRRIVARIEELFSRLDAGVAALHHAKAQLQRYRQSVLAAAVTGQLTQAWRDQHPDTKPAEELLERILEQRREQWSGKGKYKEPVLPDDSLGYALPSTWSLATIDQLQSRVQYGSSTKTDSDDDGVPVLRMGNILEGALIWDSLKFLPFDHSEFPELLLESGDLLFNRTNSPELVGKTAVFRSQRNPCSFASYLIRVRFLGGVFPEFVAAYINSHFGRAWIKSVVSQQVGQANVNGTKLRGVTLPLPPLAEQHQIVAEVEARTTAIDHLEAELDRQITRSNRLRQSTLASAFSGKLNVTNTTISPR